MKKKLEDAIHYYMQEPHPEFDSAVGLHALQKKLDKLKLAESLELALQYYRANPSPHSDIVIAALTEELLDATQAAESLEAADIIKNLDK